MKTGINRRQFHGALGWGAASIALSEFGLPRPGMAEGTAEAVAAVCSWRGVRTSRRQPFLAGLRKAGLPEE